MKDKIFRMSASALDGNGGTHVVTLVGVYQKVKESIVKDQQVIDHHSKQFVISELGKRFKRIFKLGYAICHPEDEFKQEVGERIALRRIDKNELLGSLSTYDITMLCKDQCIAIMNNEMNHILKNIDHYIEKTRKQ